MAVFKVVRQPLYEKDGKTYPVPYHGSKEMFEGLRKSIIKDMGLE